MANGILDGGLSALTGQTTSPNEEKMDSIEEPTEEQKDKVADATEEQAEAVKELDPLTIARADAQQSKERWQRALADFDNYKKRVERERVEIYENATLEIIKSILPIIEDFERVIENVPEDLKDNAWVDGTSAVGRKFIRWLEKYDITEIDPVGQPFDPDKHQGLGVDADSDMDSGLVTQTLQKGYEKGDRLLRPALVRVAG